MLIVESMQERLKNICSRAQMLRGEEYAAACFKFLTELDAAGKIRGQSAYSIQQYFWTPSALACVKELIASEEYEYDADAQSYLLTLEEDIRENLQQQSFALQNKIWY